MKQWNNSRGFTLIEMLLVIAIIAVLIAIVLPVVTQSTQKARAATDAANLRTAQAELNVYILENDGSSKTIAEVFSSYNPPASSFDTDAVMKVYYSDPAVFEIYYVSGDIYYSTAYFSDYAVNGPSSVSTANPHPGDSTHWYTVGASK